MIKAILIDDEELAIQLLQKLLDDHEQIEVVSTFEVAEKALAYLANHLVDIVFLDIEMPMTDGLEVAQRIIDLNIHVQIIFVTAYSKYALEAFELNALDYLLKPVSKERLTKTLERIENRLMAEINSSGAADLDETNRPHISSFGEFNLYRGSRKDDQVIFRTSKSKELLALLHQNLSHPIHKEKVMECLFKDENPEKANATLHTSTFYLRKVLASLHCDKALDYKNGYFTLKSDLIHSDILEFHKIFKKGSVIDANNLSTYKRLLEIYKGRYLEGQDYPWADENAAWYEEIAIDAISVLAKYYFDQRIFDQGIICARRVLELDPYNETACYYVVKGYQEMKDRPSALQFYGKFRDNLINELGIEPGDELKKLL